VRSELGYSYSSVNDELFSSRVYHFQLMSFETGKLRCFPEFSNITVAQRALLSKEYSLHSCSDFCTGLHTVRPKIETTERGDLSDDLYSSPPYES
jgi:hypothetical protein